ncbi:Nn.00g042920.m01.CDS01 [Neocucurbitaria sp. VM-36]
MTDSTALSQTMKVQETTRDVLEADAVEEPPRAPLLKPEYNDWSDEALIDAILTRTGKAKLDPRLKRRNQWIACLENLDRLADEHHGLQLHDGLVGGANVAMRHHTPDTVATAAPQKRKRTPDNEAVETKRLRNNTQRSRKPREPRSQRTVQNNVAEETHAEENLLAKAVNAPAALYGDAEDLSSRPVQKSRANGPQSMPRSQDIHMTDMGDVARMFARGATEHVEDQAGLYMANQTTNEVTTGMPPVAPNKLDKQLKKAQKPVKKTVKAGKATSMGNKKTAPKSNMDPDHNREAGTTPGDQLQESHTIGSAQEIMNEPGLIGTSNDQISDDNSYDEVMLHLAPRFSCRLVQGANDHTTEQTIAHHDKTGKKQNIDRMNATRDLGNKPSKLINKMMHARANRERPPAVTFAEISESNTSANAFSTESTHTEDADVAETSVDKGNQGKRRRHLVTADYLHVPTREEDEKHNPKLMGYPEYMRWRERMEEYKRQDAIKEGRVYEPPKYPKPYDWRDEFKDGMR